MADLSEGCVVTYAAPTLRRFLQLEDSRREDLLLVTKLWRWVPVVALPVTCFSSPACDASRHARRTFSTSLSAQES
jgi:hypothetical protein